MRSAELGSFFVADNGVSTYNYPVSNNTVNPAGPSPEAILTSTSPSSSPNTIPGSFETSGSGTVSPALSVATVIPTESSAIPSPSASTSSIPSSPLYDLLEKAKGATSQDKLDQLVEASAKAHPTAVNFKYIIK